MNNLKVNSILDAGYNSYFGFTAEEVKDMADYYGASDKYAEICEWYDGYLFGNQEIFNPWSVISYFDNGCSPETFWVSTGSNEILSNILTNADEELMERLNSLMLRQSILIPIDLNVVYPQIGDDPSFIFSFLLVAGYLKPENTSPAFPGTYMCEVSIPNKEIACVYKKEILSRLIKGSSLISSSAYKIQKALYAGDTDFLQEALQNFLYRTISFYDTSNENFYQGLLAGLLALMDDSYQITSNRESGHGCYDFQLKPRRKKLAGIIIELKVSRKDTDEALLAHAREALVQIEEKQYTLQMEQEKISPILTYGIAFSGKRVKILNGRT